MHARETGSKTVIKIHKGYIGYIRVRLGWVRLG